LLYVPLKHHLKKVDETIIVRHTVQVKPVVMLQTSQTGTNSKPYLGCSPHLKVIEAPPQKDLKLVLCYVGIYMQKVGKHLGVSIPSPSCLHSIDNHFPLAKSQRNFIHSHKSGHSPWELKRSPDFLLTCRWD